MHLLQNLKISYNLGVIDNSNFTLEPIPGKDTCKAAVLENGERYFIKFLRDYNNEKLTVEEIFNEVAEERILSALGISDLGHTVKMVNSKLAIIQKYFPKNWSCVEQEGLEITSIEEWATLLTVESWVRQCDRGMGANHHVGLAVVDGVGIKYRAIPLDLGHSFIGHPGNYNGIDDDLTPDWVKNSLFWTTRKFPKTALEETVSKAEKISIVQVLNGALDHILQATNWSEDIKTHLKNHADRAANFLYVRRPKLREVLLTWWDQANQGTEVVGEALQQPVVVAA